MPGFLSELSGVQRFLLFFTQKLRLSNPWKFKAPFLITVPYIVLLQGQYANGAAAFTAILASVLIIVGVAGIGYLTNDLGDRKKDALIKKQNATGRMSAASLALLFVLFLCLALLPWLCLPFDALSLLLLAVQFALFYAYAFKPFRLKEKGMAGVITDALYAHANPTLLAAYTFLLYTNASLTEFGLPLLFLCLWQLLLGMRNILLHQLKDLDDDRRSGTRTFVTASGKERSETLVKRWLLPMELILFIAFISLIGLYQEIPLLLPACGLFWLITRIQKKNAVTGYRSFAYTYLDNLYILWLPLFILGELVALSATYLYIAALHLLLFRSGLKDIFYKLIRQS